MRALAVLFAGAPGGAHAQRARALWSLLAEAGVTPSQTVIVHLGLIAEPELLESLLAGAPSGPLALAAINPDGLDLAADFLASLSFDLAAFAPGVAGAHLAGRLAGRLGGSALMDAESFSLEGGRIRAAKMAYAQNLKAVSVLAKPPFVLAASASLAGPASAAGPRKAEADAASEAEHQRTEEEGAAKVAGEGAAKAAGHKAPECPSPAKAPGEKLDIARFDLKKPGSDFRLDPGEPAGDLAGAEALLIGGAGLGGKAQVELMALVAEALGAQWGVTRPAALSAWAPLNRLVGVSGAMAAPKWCLVFGASGAAALYAGIAKASLIASVNTDPSAPIASRSDLFAACDAAEVLAELAGLLGRLP